MKLISICLAAGALAIQLQSTDCGCDGAGVNAYICCDEPGSHITSTTGYACAKEASNGKNQEDAILEFHDAVLCTGGEKNESGDLHESGTVYHKTHYSGHFAACLEGKEQECTK